MKDYNRLTERRDTPLVVSMWAGDGESLKIYNRLAELENKIEDGELVEVPKDCVARFYCRVNSKEVDITEFVQEEYKHRAEVAERALKDITEVLPCSVCPYDDYDGVSHQCDLDTMTCLENCLSIAERRLAQKEEGK